MRLTHETPKTPNVGKVAPKDDSRPVLTYVHLDVERAVVEATDSYCLVSVPVEIEEGDVSGPIPADVWTAFQKAHKRNAPTPSLTCGEAHFTLNANGMTPSWERGADAGTFPNVPQLIPDEDARSGFRVGLNAKLLANVAEALGSDGQVYLQFVRMGDTVEGEDTGYFPSALRPMVVTVANGGDGVGLLMPVSIPS